MLPQEPPAQPEPGERFLASSSPGLICIAVKSGALCVLVSLSQKVSGWDLGWVWVGKRCVLVAGAEAWRWLLLSGSWGCYQP